MTTVLIRRLQPSPPRAGATAVEYALMVALIALVIIAAVTLLGTNLSPSSPTRPPASDRSQSPRTTRKPQLKES